MRKNDWKYLVDALLFVDFCSTVAVGLLLAFVIPSSGRGPDTSRFFMGLHRHEWRDIHLTLSLCLPVLLTVHLWFNWAWVVHSTKSAFGGRWKKVLWSLAGAWLVVLFLSWMLVKM